MQTNQVLFKSHIVNGKVVYDAKEVHAYLEVKTKFIDWIKRKIEDYGFVENQDFVTFSQNRENGGRSIEYAITAEMGKQLSMLEKNDKGKQARLYFIECEKVLKERELPRPIQTQAELILASAQMLVEQEKRLIQIEDRMTMVEAKTATRPEYFTIMGYAIVKKAKIGMALAGVLGRKAAQLCKQKDWPIDKVYDPRFGHVGSYPKEILEEVFKVSLS